MEKRVLIAVVLSIAVMYAYSYLVPQPPKPVSGQQAAQLQPATAAPAPVPVGTQKEMPAPSPQLVPAGAATQAAQDVTVETDLYRAVFSTKGGALKRLVLKRYKETAGPQGKDVAMVAEDNAAVYPLRSNLEGFPVDAGTVFSVTASSLSVAKGEKKVLDFTLTSPTGVVFLKSYTFSGDSYAIDLVQKVTNTGSAPQSGTVQLLLTNHAAPPKDGGGRFEVFGPATLTAEGVSFDKIKELDKGEKAYQKGVLWTGFADKYFLGAALAVNNSIQSVRLKTVGGYIENVIGSAQLTARPGESLTVPVRLYFGPKDLDILKSQGSRLEEAIDLGWFSAIAKPLLFTLKFFHRYLGNYGLAIIVITVILKILFFPLTHKSYKSMKEMQKLQPKMQELKEKHKDDRDAMNKAVMELYQTHKVNPLGGCLPMVVQIPVFFALYKALMFSIELRHAPFYFWIHDLAGKDPYYVTPIIMGVTMFIQQKMTPSQMDPVQAKMMLALPVVFTFMFLNFPSGLVLYWLVNNVLTIAQQTYINKSLKEA
ncbi:membrane protein insertase YidC [Geobacter argillaceus]|uniref:Membrane protein insertase YidC n=1 Tax=Geobacter argillaceus TaxID=345631 RepID=A0A562VNP2_9BACT|nr:membrane protein insertase YidC [Geobacter argillaceus]TWJ19520.1 protein translocase subunit yidC [Geobacter argillaceus]